MSPVGLSTGPPVVSPRGSSSRGNRLSMINGCMKLRVFNYTLCPGPPHTPQQSFCPTSEESYEVCSEGCSSVNILQDLR